MQWSAVIASTGGRPRRFRELAACFGVGGQVDGSNKPVIAEEGAIAPLLRLCTHESEAVVSCGRCC